MLGKINGVLTGGSEEEVCGDVYFKGKKIEESH